MAERSLIGITGGTGIYDIPGLDIIDEVIVETPFGETSEPFILGKLKGIDIAFLPRHGRGHRITASSVNFRANIYGFKALGATALLSISAVGSMKEEFEPCDIVIPDQFFDNTRRRISTFFEGSPAIHVSLADPVCPVLSKALFESSTRMGATTHLGGTYICIEGPAFSTRGESRIFRSWGVDVIGMTAATEAKLCREAEICYASIALVTDYDVWKEDSQDVSGDLIIENLRKNSEMAKNIMMDVITRIPAERDCKCRNALSAAMLTAKEVMEEERMEELKIFLRRHQDAD